MLRKLAEFFVIVFAVVWCVGISVLTFLWVFGLETDMQVYERVKEKMERLK